jgi:quinol monooxygenase YgiN
MGNKIIKILVVTMATILSQNTSAQEKNQVVRVAKIKIDSVHGEEYNALLKEAIETAIRLEPGVLMLYAVHDKKDRTSVTVFEIYADVNAYQSHLQTTHFKKYKSATASMIKSLELNDVESIALGAKHPK